MGYINSQIGGTSQTTTSESEKVGPPGAGVLLAPRVLLDRRVIKALEDHRVLMVQEEKKGPLDHKVRLVSKVRKGHRV